MGTSRKSEELIFNDHTTTTLDVRRLNWFKKNMSRVVLLNETIVGFFPLILRIFNRIHFLLLLFSSKIGSG